MNTGITAWVVSQRSGGCYRDDVARMVDVDGKTGFLVFPELEIIEEAMRFGQPLGSLAGLSSEPCQSLLGFRKLVLQTDPILCYLPASLCALGGRPR